MRAEGWVVIRLNSHKYLIDGRWQAAYHLYGMGKDSHKGMPDLIGFKNNRVLLVEVKKPGGIIRPSQIKVKQFMENHNVNYHVVSSISEILEILHENYDIIQ